MAILEHLGESVPELDERTLRDMRADKGTSRIARHMQLRLKMDSSVLDREWPSLCERYEAEARERTTATT